MDGKRLCIRLGLYGFGVAILAIGITLNTKTGLGISPLISLPFCISQIWDLNFAAMTFLTYSSYVGIQALLLRRRFRPQMLLQIPFSLVFSLFLDGFGVLLDVHFAALWQNLLLLLAAMVLTGVGAAMVVNMKIVANPADSLSSTVGEVTKRGMGFGKNLIDIISVCITVLTGLIFAHRVIGIGLGTVLSMIVIGRVVALTNYLWKEKMTRLAGIA